MTTREVEEGQRLNAVRKILAIPAIHARMQHLNGEAIVGVLKDVIHAHCPEVPFGRSGRPRWS